MHGDHIIPRSRGGLTVWENLTLRCGQCNLLKSNKLF
ncbi:MAG: HNH endonuclease signature motif containing protein [Nostoc sp.]